jgi:diguanylate cyclase (GGDEF)-like protein
MTAATPPASTPAASPTRDGGPAAPWSTTRLGIRLRGDAQLLLAIAVAIPILVMEGLSDNPRRSLGLLAPLLFIGAQIWLTTLRSTPAWLPSARLAMCLAFIALANVWVDPTGTWPLSALAIPVVALAAATHGRAAVIVAFAGMTVMLVPMALPTLDVAARQSVLAATMAAIALAYGTRRMIMNLERSSERLRRANHRAQRRAKQLAAVESVGSLLAREGPTSGTLDRVMGLLEGTFGYRYPSVYVWDGQALQLGAHRNYRFPIQTFTPEQGILGRVLRTREPVFLPDARHDPEFVSADPDVMSEISIPLQTDGELLGVLNVETNGEHRLDEDDFATMQIVGDRLAASLALGRERQKLTERAALLERLTAFATVLGSSLDPATMDDEVAMGAATVIPADSVVLVSRDDASNQYLISGIAGGDLSVVGKEVEPGEGVSGRAIVARTVVVDDKLERSTFPKAVAHVKLPDVLAAMAAPMVIGDEVVGVVTWLRGDLSRVFTAQEREIAALLAGKVGLALANAHLHQATRNAAITDPLTGIHNRRHFDAALEREDALRRRTPAENRRLRSAILFDLDHFGVVNKQHGHQVGDRVLRLFAETLRARARASDLVARYGGEEFVVILESATREDATVVAEAVRKAFARESVETASGERLTTTVSAGCSTLEPWEVEGSLLLERADVALAMAKAGGRDQVVAA